MNRSPFFSGLALGAILIFAFALKAQIPPLINYQGILQDASGNPISGLQSITFVIYSTATGGTPLWTETQSVTVTNGYFSTLLGSISPFSADLFSGGERYLAVKVGNDPEMTPRKPIASVGFALKPADTDKLAGKEALDFATAIHNHWGSNWSGTGIGLRISSNIDLSLHAVQEARAEPNFWHNGRIRFIPNIKTSEFYEGHF
ncbi:MAG: hypothetical protein GWN55_06815 [Phycisphaerae bacterium]|nr:hypothetical protein [candidate division KSB1 bacterium]NIV01022.1 hypothetical protein [Phycisphaerae bacterium]NIS25010.1 hypothetical protein [candidate division KSB1 bacterium]NIT72818.1 hypothetical protein [candidate division KSB1 bacterium]NIU25662.1 hypothetical protein [candidate division KSB1 bacterium]